MVVDAPASTIPVIVGSKGSTLKQIRDQTGVKIDIPRKDATGGGHANGGLQDASRTIIPLPTSPDEEEEPTIPVTIVGPLPLALEAQALVNEIITSMTSTITQRVKDIPVHVLPFIIPRRNIFQDAADGAPISLSLNVNAREITVDGDREGVNRVVETIKSAVDYFTKEITSFKLSLPKRQHRLLIGKAAEEIMASSKCAVIIAKPEEPGDEIVVWGKAADLSGGMGAVLEKANSAYIHEFPLPGPINISRQLLNYMIRVDYPATLSDAHPGVSVYTPHLATIDKAQVLNVDLVGEKPAVDAAVRQVSELIGKLIGATKDVQIEWLIHHFINSHKNAKK